MTTNPCTSSLAFNHHLIPRLIFIFAIDSSDNEIAALRPCSILVTQPRRVSALGVAARVANERLEDVEKASGSVGYAIRGERKAGRDTRLLFLTTGVLLRRLSAGGDANLDGITHVIVDEVRPYPKLARLRILYSQWFSELISPVHPFISH